MSTEEEEKSRERAGKSAVAVAKAGAAIAATAVVGPLGGLAVTALAQLGEHALGLYRERIDKRIESFHQHLLSGVPSEHQAELVQGLLNREDATGHYASILEKAAQDDEREKIPLYANLLLHFALRAEGATRVEQIERHLVRSLSELRFDDITLLLGFKKLADSAPRRPPSTQRDGVVYPDQEASAEWDTYNRKHAQFAEDRSPLEFAGINRLEHAGMLHRRDMGGGPRYDVTMIGINLLNAIRDRSEERS